MCNILVKPTLVYGSEVWTQVKMDIKKISPPQMRIMRKSASYTNMDKKRNVNTQNELQLQQCLFSKLNLNLNGNDGYRESLELGLLKRMYISLLLEGKVIVY